MSPKKDFIDITDLYQKSFSGIGADILPIANAFNEIIGDKLSQVCTVTSVKNSTLRVRCVSSAWAQAISLKQDDILFKLKERYPSVYLKNIHASAGLVDKPTSDKLTPKIKAIPTDETKRKASDLSKDITDPLLQRSLNRAITATLTVKEQK